MPEHPFRLEETELARLSLPSDFDLLTADLSDGAGLALDAEELSSARAYQRLARLGVSASDARRLREAGYDSAQSIAAVSEDLFVSRAADAAGMDEETLRAVHGRARTTRARVHHLWAGLQARLGAHERALRVLSDSAPFEALAGDLPDYPSLFGSVNYCECPHCRSIFGPAAYFTDLMRVTATYITGGNTIPDHWKLEDRRRDLFEMELTCENTTTPVRFLRIANDVLGDKITDGLHGDADYLSATRAVSPALPLNLPLSTVRAALERMQASLAGVYASLAGPGAATLPTAAQVEREQLGLSVEQERLARTPTADGSKLAVYYDVPQVVLMAALPGTYSAATDSRTVTASGEDFHGKVSPGDTLFAAGVARIVTEVPATGTTFTVDTAFTAAFSGQAAKVLAAGSIAQLARFRYATGLEYDEVASLLRQRLDAEELENNLAAYFYVNGGAGTGPWADIVEDTTDPAALVQYLARWRVAADGAWTQSDLDLETLDRLNRFSRLARWLGWTYEELDIALRAGGAPPLETDAAFALLSQTAVTSRAYRLAVDQAAALWGDMNTYGRGPAGPLAADLFDRVYNRPHAGDPRPAYRPVYAKNPLFKTPVEEWTILGADPAQAGTRAWLAGSLGFTGDELTAAATFAAGGGAVLPLDVPNLSALYRLRLLSTALRLGIPDLLQLFALAGVATAAPTPAQVAKLTGLAAWTAEAGLRVPELVYLTTGVPPRGFVPPLPSERVLPFLKTLWTQSQDWMVTAAQLQATSQTPEQADATREKLVQARYLDARGVVAVTVAQFQASSAKFPVTAANLESPGLVSQDQAAAALGRLQAERVVDGAGALEAPVDANTNLSDIFPPSPEQPSRTAWVRGVLEERSSRVAFDLFSPVLPLKAEDFVVGTITPEAAAEAFGQLKAHGVLTAEGALAAPFDPATDLSYLFGGDTAEIELARSVLTSASQTVWHVSLAMVNGLHAQQYGTYKELAGAAATSPPMAGVLAPDAAAGVSLDALVVTLLTPVPDGSPLPPKVLEFFGLYARLVTAATRFRLAPWDMEGAVEHPAAFGFADVNALTLEVLRSLWAYAAFTRRFGLLQGQLIPVLVFPDDTFAALSLLTGWPRGQIEELAKAFWPPAGAGWNTVPGVARMAAAFRQAGAIGIDVYTLLQVGKLAGVASLPFPPLDGPPATDPGSQAPQWTVYQAAAGAMYDTLAARYDEVQWAEVSASLEQALDEERRDARVPLAIVALRATVPEVADRRALSEYLLLDVEMSGCDVTSKVAQGIASVQTYMQRCRLRLERGVEAIPFPEVWWEWLSAYRVWEANRKIYVYPENYLEPAIRRRKTPLFDQVMDALNQSDVTEQSVHRAFVDYMDGFAEQAGIQVVESLRATAPDPWSGAPADTLFLVGRTPTAPHDFFLRRLVDNVAWTVWEKVDVKISAASVVPVWALGRLFLFWVETEPVEINSIGGSGGTVSQTNAAAWQVRTLYSWQQFNGTWTAPQTLAANTVFAFEGYETTYAPWGIDYQAIVPSDIVWHRPWPIPVPAGEEGEELLVVLSGQAYQSTGQAAVPSPPETPFRELDRLLREVQSAATFGTAVVKTGFVGAVPLLAGRTLDASLSATGGNAVMQTDQIGEYPSALYAAANLTGTAPGQTLQLALFLANNPFVANALGDSPLLTDSSPQINPWHVGGPRPILYNLPVDVAWVKPVRNQVGWLLWNNGDESFLGRAEIADARTLSEITDYNPITVNGPNDIVLFAGAGVYGATPNLETVKVAFLRLSAGAVQRVSRILRAQGVPAMLATSVQADPGPASLSFTRFYVDGQAPTGPCSPTGGSAATPAQVTPPSTLCGGQVDFGRRGDPSAYGLYWWEVFFHIPYLIATQLGTHQRFEDAKTWWEYIFNPTAQDAANPAEDRYWRFLPFRGQTPPSLLQILGDPAAIQAWNNHPFDPFAIADLRVSAYQKAVVMRYIDNLLEWGDARFAQDTRESITEATLLYTLAADILGPRPQSRGPCAQQPAMSFDEILAHYGDDPSKIPQFLVNLEQQLAPLSTPVTVGEDALPFNEINAYFCAPENPELIALWDKVEDRMFKIRHCLNLEGVARPLALFAPALDPALLAAGAAAGNLKDIIQGSQAAIPHYRFWTMLERAKGLTSTLIGFGSSLLAALDRRDAEALALLQNNQQRQVLRMTTQLKEQAVEDAAESLASLREQLAGARYRQSYYEGLMSTGLSAAEVSGIVNMVVANAFALLGGIYHTAAGAAFLIPNAGSPFAMTYGGKQIGSALNAVGTFFDTMSGQFSFASMLSNTVGEYQRRAQEWQNQATLAEYEAGALERQVAGAQVRQAMAERDLEITVTQVAQADEMIDFLTGKFTSVELYQWMAAQLSTVYFQAYQTAYAMAVGAQRALQFELNTSDPFVGYGYWNSLRKGLTAGESLMLALGQMEEAYLRRNGRRLAVEKTVSLMQLDPLALLRLQQTGACTFELPARLFDGDFPGHYARKITGVSVTLPTVAGPYQNVSGTLLQTGSFIALTADPQAELFLLGKQGVEPPGPAQLAVNPKANQQIALSTGMDDTGVFPDAGDDRYAPFEGTGAISQWRLEIPQATNAIDVGAIPDVVLRLTYTALPGGAGLAGPVIECLAEQGWSGGRLVFLAGQYSTAWFGFMNPPAGSVEQSMQFVTPRTFFPGNVSEAELQQAYLSLALAPEVEFSGPLVVGVKVPGAEQEETVTFTGGSTLQPIPFPAPNSDFTTRPWTLTVRKAGVPEELADPVTGLLDPAKLVNLGLVMMATGTIAWSGK